MFAPVVRGVLWPAQAVNKPSNGSDLGALCKRGKALIRKAVDEDDESRRRRRRAVQEAAPGGAVRSIRCVATGRLFATMAEVQQYAAETGLTSFEEATESGDSTAAADYWWLYALVAAAVFYCTCRRRFALWPLLDEDLGLRGRAVALLLRRAGGVWFVLPSTLSSARRSFAGP